MREHFASWPENFSSFSDHAAQTIGNHEFDNGVAGLVPFIRNASFPVVCANINGSLDSDWVPELVRPYVVLARGGERVGVVGYISQDTPQLSKTGRINGLSGHLLTCS